MRKSVKINLYGVDLFVTGNYYKGSFGNYENPPEKSEFEIIRIELTDSKINLHELFYHLNKIETISNECLEKL
jgi:hypothetical protein